MYMKKNREGPVKGLRSKKAWNAWPRIMETWWLSWTGHRILRTGWHSVFTNFNWGEPVKLAVFTYAHPCRRGQSVEKELLGEFSGEVACQASLTCGETGSVWTTGLYFFFKHFAYSSGCISLFPVRQYFLSATNSGQYLLGTLQCFQCFRGHSNPCASSLSPLISPRPPRGNAVISVSQMKALMWREIKQQAQDHKVSS